MNIDMRAFGVGHIWHPVRHRQRTAATIGGVMTTDYTMYAYWVTQKPPMAVKVAMAKEAIKQGITKDMFVHKNMEGITDVWFGQDWYYAYELAEDDLRESTEG